MDINAISDVSMNVNTDIISHIAPNDSCDYTPNIRIDIIANLIFNIHPDIMPNDTFNVLFYIFHLYKFDCMDS